MTLGNNKVMSLVHTYAHGYTWTKFMGIYEIYKIEAS